MALDRRTFLRALGLSGAGLAFGGYQTHALPEHAARERISSQIGGSVKSNAKGLAGVVVSDGFTVTSTDGKGRYQLVAHPSADFVFISIPRRYVFSHQGGITNFYQRIISDGKKQSIDFELEKLAVDDARHNFIVWADPQIQNAEDAKLLNTQSAPDALELVKSYGDGALFHGIGCGDLVWDKFDLFNDYKASIGKVGVPFFQVIGNHDMDLDARTDEGSAATFKSHFGPSYYSFNRGEIHYVVLDDVFFLGTSKNYIGYIAEQQFRWLEKDLSFVKSGTTVVVSVHIPVNTGVRRRNQLKEEPIGGVVANRQELYRLLKPYRAHIMSGHTHFNEKVFEGDNVIEHVHGTVCGAWWTGPICYDGTPNGYGVYEVHGSELKWFYKSVGRERDFQMRVYPVGSVEERKAEFAVNVWNWDPKWKVEWFEDGTFKGSLERATTFDPLSVQLHEGSEKPSVRSWVEPQLTDHMFFGIPSPEAKQITIQVTDRFGSVYKELVNVEDLIKDQVAVGMD